MGYRDREKKRAYDRKWIAARRAKYLGGKLCAECGANDQLELHHINPTDKVTHKIWSWNKDRLENELSKCIFMCRKCHTEWHRQYVLSKRIHGNSSTYKNGCRCAACREAYRQCAKKYRQGLMEVVQLTASELSSFTVLAE